MFIKRNNGICRFLVLFSTGCIILTIFCFFAPISEAGELYDGIIRLHVIADSDNKEDQELKLCVRDKVLQYISPDIESCKTKEQAENYLSGKLDSIEKVASDYIKDKGFSYGAKAVLCNEYYPTREYESVRLPAGEYLSLRVIIGDGEGQNWWCMVYPPLCTSSAKAGEELSEAGFSPNQVRLLTDDEDSTYVLRFKFIETLSGMWQRIKRSFSGYSYIPYIR